MACGPIVKPCIVIVNKLVGIDAPKVFRTNELVAALADIESPNTLDETIAGVTFSANRSEGYVKVMTPPGSITLHGRKATLTDTCDLFVTRSEDRI